MMPRFCTRCGQPLQVAAARPQRRICPGCGRHAWNAAAACAGVLLTSPDGKLLLAQRTRDPFAGWWDVVGGFVSGAEHPEDAARREVAEETGLRVNRLELLGVLVDTYQTEDDYTLNFHYIGRPEPGTPRPHDDVAGLRWFAPEEIPSSEVAFANGREAIRLWVRKIST